MTNYHDYLLAEGDDVRREVFEAKPKRARVRYLNLKDGQSLRGFLLTDDFKSYMCHSDFHKGIKSHTCLNANDKTGILCISCQHKIKRFVKTIVPFWNVDSRQIEVFDASQVAMKTVDAFVAEYKNDSTEIPVYLNRTGTGINTIYTLSATVVRPAERDLFTVPKEIIVDDTFYKAALHVKTNEEIAKLIGVQFSRTDIA